MLTGDVVKQNARDTIWHIRMAAEALEHSTCSWGVVAHESTEETPEDVKSQRIRCMNIIGELCRRLGTMVSILGGEDKPYPLKENLRAIIELCDERMKDLYVSPVERLKELGRKEAEQNPKPVPKKRPRPSMLQ